MACVYVLHSANLDRYYTGSCVDFEVRWNDHRSKVYSDSFTAKTDDWEVFFTIDELNQEQARAIEAHIKKMKSKVYIQNLARYPEMVEKLKERFRPARPQY
jgi:putative endonuclease